jgi:4-amino-4-deoxy-L-arabinose transferase-like glycosyltransferase
MLSTLMHNTTRWRVAGSGATAAADTAVKGAILPRRDAGILALVTLVGLAVRLYGLTSYGIWFDEGYHIALVQLPTVGAMLDAVLSNPPSDPLYVLLLRGWVSLFGSGDAAVRLLSVLISTATLPATYALGRVMASRAVGLLGACLFALSPYAVELGQEAALYSLAALTTTAALAVGWHWHQSGRGAWLYVALGVVAIYSHYVVAAILALFALLALHPAAGARRIATKVWLSAHAAIFIAWVPWLVALAAHWLSSELPRATLYHPATPEELLDALIRFTSGSATRLQSASPVEVLGLFAGGALFALGLLAATRGLRLLALVSGTIFLAPAVVSRVTGLWLFVPHFMLFLLPSLMLILACGAIWALQRRSMRWVGAVLIAVWLAVQLAGLWLYNQYPPHGADGLRELAATLRERNQGEPVLVTPAVLFVTLRQYYPGPIHGLPADFDLRTVYGRYDPDAWKANALATLQTRIATRDRFWLVYRPELDRDGDFLRAIQATHAQAFHQHYDYADLYGFER